MWGLILLATVAFAGVAQAESIWSHNGSLVALDENGTSRTFRYREPRGRLPVKPGTVLFEGTLEGRDIAGNAYQFSQKCGAVSYPVRGRIASDEASITLAGRAPRRNADCAESGGTPQVLVFTRVAARSSLANLKQDPRSQFAHLKHAMFTVEPDEPPKAFQGTYHLAYCAPAMVQYWARDAFVQELTGLAFELVATHKALARLAYPEQLWRPSLEEYEARQLAHIVSRGERSDNIANEIGERLTKALEAWRKRNRPRSPEIYVSWQSKCGDYFVSVKIVTRPAGGRVLYLPSLYAAFCQAQGLNGTDFRACNQYDERSDGENATVSGAYVYRATWPDGRIGVGRRDFGPNPTEKQWIIEPSH